MSLASLKKPARSVERARPEKPEAIDIDAFIEDAVVYANGGNRAECNNVVEFCNKQTDIKTKSPLKRATFTLGDEAIERLAKLATDFQVSKSKMLRLLIAEYSLRRRGR